MYEIRSSLMTVGSFLSFLMKDFSYPSLFLCTLIVVLQEWADGERVKRFRREKTRNGTLFASLFAREMGLRRRVVV